MYGGIRIIHFPSRLYSRCLGCVSTGLVLDAVPCLITHTQIISYPNSLQKANKNSYNALPSGDMQELLIALFEAGITWGCRLGQE